MFFPGIQGGPLVHVIAAKAVCLREAMQPEISRLYRTQVAAYCPRHWPPGIAGRGFTSALAAERTPSPAVLVELHTRGISGKDAQNSLDRAASLLAREH